MTLNWQAASEIAQKNVSSWADDAPGGAVIGFDGETIRFAHAGGVESLATLTPFSPDSVVRYASVTKHVFCAMVLAHADEIGLDDRLGKHLPELQAPLSDVTVGQALDMSGGLPDVRECLSLLGLSVFTETQKAELLAYVGRLTRLNFDAGTEVSYSNTGYRLVEAILERKGVGFNAFVEQQLAAPLKTFLTAPEVWADPVKDLVPGYWKADGGWQLSWAGLQISASGSLAGSATALTTWLQALISGTGAFAGVLEKLSAQRFLADGRPSGYGLGLRWSRLGDQKFVGHGGSHPGYKTYFLLDPQSRSGFVIVSNREDTNGYKIALEAMSALTGLALPKTGCIIPDGLYVTETGPWWLQVKAGVSTFLDSDDTLYDDGDGWFSSRSASSPMRLRWTGDAVEGQGGHAERRFLPVIPVMLDTANTDDASIAADLQGHWVCDEGAQLDIRDGAVFMGVGPTRQTMPLTALGNGRFLFTLKDGPWTKRICLNRLDGDRFELVLSRARMIEYRRSA